MILEFGRKSAADDARDAYREHLHVADDSDAITTRPTAAEEAAEEATVRGGASDPAAGLTHAESGDPNT